jgi:regulator of replication initiation timing
MDWDDNRNNAARSIQELETTIYNAFEELEQLKEQNHKLITKCIHLETELLRLERLNNG